MSGAGFFTRLLNSPLDDDLCRPALQPQTESGSYSTIIPRHHLPFQPGVGSHPPSLLDDPSLISLPPPSFDNVNWQDPEVQELLREVMPDIARIHGPLGGDIPSIPSVSPRPFTCSTTTTDSTLLPVPARISSQDHPAANSAPSSGDSDANSGRDVAASPPLAIPNTAVDNHDDDAQDAAPGTMDEEGDNSSWAARNPNVPVLPICHLAPREIEKITAYRLSVEKQKSKQEALSVAIKERHNSYVSSLRTLASTHDVTVDKVTKLAFGLSSYKKKRDVNLSNALMFAKAKEVNAGKHSCRFKCLR